MYLTCFLCLCPGIGFELADTHDTLGKEATKFGDTDMVDVSLAEFVNIIKDSCLEYTQGSQTECVRVRGAGTRAPAARIKQHAGKVYRTGYIELRDSRQFEEDDANGKPVTKTENSPDKKFPGQAGTYIIRYAAFDKQGNMGVPAKRNFRVGLPSEESTGLGAGGTAGVAIACVCVIALIVAGTLYQKRRKQSGHPNR